MNPSGWDAAAAGAVAALVTAAVTPFSSRIARQVGAIDEPRSRGLSEHPTPRLGGLAIFCGVALAALLFLPVVDQGRWRAIIAGAALVALIGALDDVLDLHAAVKLAGQVVAVLIPVLQGVRVETFTLPFIHRVDLGETLGIVLTTIGVVLIVNVVNFSDGVDGLA